MKRINYVKSNLESNNMPTLIFISAKQVNYDKSGMQMIYSYKISGLERVYSFHVVGLNNYHDMTPYERYNYAQFLFSGTIAYLKQYWYVHKKLPEAAEEIREDLNFNRRTGDRIPWSKYKLILL